MSAYFFLQPFWMELVQTSNYSEVYIAVVRDRTNHFIPFREDTNGALSPIKIKWELLFEPTTRNKQPTCLVVPTVPSSNFWEEDLEHLLKLI